MKLESFLRTAYKQGGALLEQIPKNESIKTITALGLGLSAAAYGIKSTLFGIPVAIKTAQAAAAIASFQTLQVDKTFPYLASDFSFLAKIAATLGISCVSGIGAKEIFPLLFSAITLWNFKNKNYLTEHLGSNIYINWTHFIQELGAANTSWIVGTTTLITFYATSKLFNIT